MNSIPIPLDFNKDVMHYKVVVGKIDLIMQALNKKCGCKKDCQCFTIYDDTYDSAFYVFYYKQNGNRILKIGIYQIFVTFVNCTNISPSVGSIDIEIEKKNKYSLSKTLYGDCIITLRDGIDMIDSVNIIKLL